MRLLLGIPSVTLTTRLGTKPKPNTTQINCNASQKPCRVDRSIGVTTLRPPSKGIMCVCFFYVFIRGPNNDIWWSMEYRDCVERMELWVWLYMNMMCPSWKRRGLPARSMRGSLQRRSELGAEWAYTPNLS